MSTQASDVQAAIQQGSAAWKASRRGLITASRMADVLARSKKTKEPLKAYFDYRTDLATERLGGEIPGFGNAATQWGVDLEPVARGAVEAELGILIEKLPFVVHPSIDYVGASPDGVFDIDAGWEGKCPYNSSVHLTTILQGMPEEHIPQVQSGMWVTGRSRWLFSSFDPRQAPELRLYLQWINRDDAYIAEMARACAVLNDEVNDEVAAIRRAPMRRGF